MNKVKNVLAITGVILTFMTGLCTVMTAGVESVEKIKSLSGE